jgi:hypothetical protein
MLVPCWCWPLVLLLACAFRGVGGGVERGLVVVGCWFGTLLGPETSGPAGPDGLAWLVGFVVFDLLIVDASISPRWRRWSGRPVRSVRSVCGVELVGFGRLGGGVVVGCAM